MDREKATEILKDALVKDSVNLHSLGWYLAWSPDKSCNHATLDGSFSADDLEAIAWWMRNNG